jgi:hypothetical protein
MYGRRSGVVGIVTRSERAGDDAAGGSPGGRGAGVTP